MNLQGGCKVIFKERKWVFFRQWLFLSLRSRSLLKFCSLKYTYLGFKKLQVFVVFFSLVLHRTLFYYAMCHCMCSLERFPTCFSYPGFQHFLFLIWSGVVEEPVFYVLPLKRYWLLLVFCINLLIYPFILLGTRKLVSWMKALKKRFRPTFQFWYVELYGN